MKHETYFGDEMFITKNKHSLKNTLWSIETKNVSFHKTKHISSLDSNTTLLTLTVMTTVTIVTMIIATTVTIVTTTMMKMFLMKFFQWTLPVNSINN